MMKLTDMIKAYEDEGYDNVQAQARVSQDVVVMTDVDGTSIKTKMDIGVHKNLSIEQDEYCFDIAYLDDGLTVYFT